MTTAASTGRINVSYDKALGSIRRLVKGNWKGWYGGGFREIKSRAQFLRETGLRDRDIPKDAYTYWLSPTGAGPAVCEALVERRVSADETHFDIRSPAATARARRASSSSATATPRAWSASFSVWRRRA